MANPNEHQVGGEHYKGDYQHWDLCADVPYNYFEGQITKYVARWQQKGGVQDVEKAVHYLDKLWSLYQTARLELPRKERATGPVFRFESQHELTDAELMIFIRTATYLTFEDLDDLRRRLEELHKRAVGLAIDCQYDEEPDPEKILPSAY